MKAFDYKAKNVNAEDVAGRIVASGKNEALMELRGRGMTVVAIEEAQREKRTVKRESWRRMTGVRSKHLVGFSKRMVTLLNAGVPLLRALNVLATQADDDYFAEVLSDIEDDVRSGKTLSEGMSGYPKVFSPFYVAMVKSGERTGALDGAMRTLAEYYERQQKLITKVRNAMAYPALVLAVGIMTLVFVFTNVMPRIMPILERLDTELPLSTRALMGISAFMRLNWPWILLAFAVAAALFARGMKSPAFRRQLSAFKLKMPLFGDVIYKAELARFTRALEIGLASGIPITRALDIALPILKEVDISERLSRCSSSLESGDTLEASFRACEVFDDFVLSIIHVGEESGNLTGTLSEVADEFEQQATSKVDVMVTMLEPVMILIIAIIIGFIVIAVLLPIFNLDFLQL